MAKTPRKAVSTRRAPRAAKPLPPDPSLQTLQQAGGAAVRSLARQLHSWTGSLLGGVGTAADMSLAPSPDHNAYPPWHPAFCVLRPDEMSLIGYRREFVRPSPFRSFIPIQSQCVLACNHAITHPKVPVTTAHSFIHVSHKF